MDHRSDQYLSSHPRIPTSVIPTTNGALCLPANPSGQNTTMDFKRLTNTLRCSRSKNPTDYRNNDTQTLPNNVNDKPGTSVLLYPSFSNDVPGLRRDHLPPDTVQITPNPYPTLQLPVTEQSSGAKMSSPSPEKVNKPKNLLVVSKATQSPITSIAASETAGDGVQTPNFENVQQMPDQDNYNGSVGSNPSSQTNSRVFRMAERVNKNSRCRCCLFAMAFMCAVNVVFFLFAYDKVVETVAASQLALRDSGVKFEAWSKTSVPVYYKVTAFNLTNPYAFMDGDRPRVREIGPYTYRMVEEKVNVTFHDNGTVTYKTKPTYFFEPSLSGGSEEDLMWTVNIPFVNAADAVKANPVLKTVINYAANIHNFETLKHLTVKELLWGHPSNVLDWGRMFQELPYPHLHFGLLVGFNNTPQESYTMYTGAGDPHKMNAIHSWNGHTKLDFWSGDSCNKIDGTDAGGFSPGVSPKDTLHIFNGQLCRSIPLVFHKSVKQAGIDAYQFVPPSDVFSYGPSNPENMCFCSGGRCPPRGVLDMKPCYWGAAIAFSFPHFYQGDSVLRHMVRGLRPDPSKHKTEFDIFPDLGIPIRVKLRMQMNVVLDRNQALGRARHFDLIYPIFWFEAGIDSLPSNLSEQLQMAQNLPPLMKSVFLVVSGLLTVVFIIVLMAHTILNWCSSGLSSLRSLSSRGSSRQDTRSTTPDLEGDHGSRGGTDAMVPQNGESELPNSDASVSPHIDGVADIPVRIIDYHTLLPPYKATKEENKVPGPSNNFGNGSSNDVVDSSNRHDTRTENSVSDHENYEVDNGGSNFSLHHDVTAHAGVNKTPPGSNSSSLSVSAEVHHSASYADVRALEGNSSRRLPDTHIVASAQPQAPPQAPGSEIAQLQPVQHLRQEIERRPMVHFASPKCVRLTLKEIDLPPFKVAPLASPEETDLPRTPPGDGPDQDAGNNQEPFATSTPHETTLDVQPSLVGGEVPVEQDVFNERTPF